MKKQVKFQLDGSSSPTQNCNHAIRVLETSSGDIVDVRQQIEVEEDEIEKLYESLTSDMKGLKSGNVENLKGKLEAIRRNKVLLEDKIKEYEKKLGK